MERAITYARLLDADAAGTDWQADRACKVFPRFGDPGVAVQSRRAHFPTSESLTGTPSFRAKAYRSAAVANALADVFVRISEPRMLGVFSQYGPKHSPSIIVATTRIF
jgi:hypothetical protein